MYFIRYYILLFILTAISACSEKQRPPLKGERLNVLKYDILQEKKKTNIKVVLPEQEHNNGWFSSDYHQSKFLSPNIKLAKELQLDKQLKLHRFNATSSDSAMVIVDNIAYTYSNSIASATDLKNSKLLWSVEIIKDDEKKSIIGGSMAFYQDILFIATGTTKLAALSVKDGKQLWIYDAPNVLRYVPLIESNQVFVTTIDNTLLCLNKDGNLLWRYDAPTYSIAPDRLITPSFTFEDKLFTMTTAGDLVVLRKFNGEELMEVNLASASIIGDGNISKAPLNSPYLLKNKLYILTSESEIIKIDLTIPDIVWRQSFPGANSMWVTNKQTFVLMDNNQMAAIDNETSNIIWIVDLPKDPKNKEYLESYGPIVAGDLVYLVNEKGLLSAFSSYDGSLIKTYTSEPTNIPPIVIDEKLYIIGKNGKINIFK